MTLRSRIAAPFVAAGKALSSGLKATMSWSGRATWGLMWALRTKFDYAKEVGDGSRSSIVMSVLLWMSRTFPEAPLFVGRELLGTGLELERVPGHPMTRLIERPNKFYSGVLLWTATIIDWALTGNAYWIKVRSEADLPVELWWVPSHLIEPKWPNDGKTFVGWYDYKPDPGRQARRIEVRDVVHFRYGMDPNNTRKGRTALATLLREIFTDEEAANMTAALMKNLGVPGVIIAPDSPDAKVEDDAAQEVKDEFKRDFSGDNRGEPMVMKGPTKVSVLSWSPDQMNLRDLRRIPEERVTAVYGVAAVVVGLGAGLDRSTFANFHEARESAYESNIIPTQRLFAAELRSQLLPDFDDDPELMPAFDLTQVRVLQPDMDKLYERVNKGVNGGWLTEADARRAVGMPTEPEHDRYLRPLHITEVPAGGRKAEMPMLPADADNPANQDG